MSNIIELPIKKGTPLLMRVAFEISLTPIGVEIIEPDGTTRLLQDDAVLDGSNIVDFREK